MAIGRDITQACNASPVSEMRLVAVGAVEAQRFEHGHHHDGGGTGRAP